MPTPKNDKMSLDVSAPDHVPMVLAFVADKYRQDAAELQAAHQDHKAGQEWVWLAKRLEKLDKDLREYLGSLGYTQFTDG